MKFSVSVLLLAACAATSGTSSYSHRPAGTPAAATSLSWTAISTNDVPRADVRQAIMDLLGLVDIDSLWPEFNWSDHGVILVVGNGEEGSVAYCVGICNPEIALRGTSRVWRTTSPVLIKPGEFRFLPLSAWGLRGSGDVVGVGFESRERSALTAVHEDFHLHYQSRYSIAFGDAIGSTDEMSPATRAWLQNEYSRADPTAHDLREECAALADALHGSMNDRGKAMAALRRFVAVRDARRARPGTPVSEEDFWERQEGVPTNLERRAAAKMKFADQSAIAAALTESGCEAVTNGSYFLVIGGLEAAVLDAFTDPQMWPRLVYPRDGTRASSLFALVRALSRQPEER